MQVGNYYPSKVFYRISANFLCLAHFFYRCFLSTFFSSHSFCLSFLCPSLHFISFTWASFPLISFLLFHSWSHKMSSLWIHGDIQQRGWTKYGLIFAGAWWWKSLGQHTHLTRYKIKFYIKRDHVFSGSYLQLKVMTQNVKRWKDQCLFRSYNNGLCMMTSFSYRALSKNQHQQLGQCSRNLLPEWSWVPILECCSWVIVISPDCRWNVKKGKDGMPCRV